MWHHIIEEGQMIREERTLDPNPEKGEGIFQTDTEKGIPSREAT